MSCIKVKSLYCIHHQSI